MEIGFIWPTIAFTGCFDEFLLGKPHAHPKNETCLEDKHILLQVLPTLTNYDIVSERFWHIIWKYIWQICILWQSLAYILTFYPAQVLTFFLTCVRVRVCPDWYRARNGLRARVCPGWAGILSGISPDIRTASLSGIYSDIHTVWHLFWTSFWHSIRHLILTFCLAFYLAFFLVFRLFFWHSIWHLFWTSFWHSIRHLILTFCLAFYLASILTFHTIWHLFWTSFWHSIRHLILTFCLAFFLASVLFYSCILESILAFNFSKTKYIVDRHANDLDWQFFQEKDNAGNGEKWKERKTKNKQWTEMKRNENNEQKWKNWKNE